MRIAVGLIGHSILWEHLLRQEGVPFGYVSVDEMNDKWSVLVVTRPPDGVEGKRIQQYLKDGGAVLGPTAFLGDVCNMTSRTEMIEYLTSDGHPPFPDTHMLDVGLVGEIPREANCLRTQQHVYAAFAGTIGGGYAVILPFDPAAVMADDRQANKSFYSVRDRLPSERVSLVSKGEIQRLVHRSLAFLHHARKLPYAHLWYFPGEGRTRFAFRIDSDKGSRQEVDMLHRIAVEHDIPMTWFLDVKSHEEWLHHFAFLTGQEFGVHCYEHRVFDTFEGNVKNISRARLKLDRVGISSPGFAAPFGTWNTELARALDHVGFEYSSEFSYAYDALPLYSWINNETRGILQVPVHPVCIGSLRRVGYSETHMIDYFKRVMDEKLLRNESWFFYHHPTHRSWDAVRFIFQYAKDQGVEPISMTEYARWWQKRLKTRLVLHTTDQSVSCEGQLPDASVSLRIVLEDNREAILPVTPTIDLGTVQWHQPRPTAAAPPDIHRIREFDPRNLVGDLFTTLSRRFSERRTE